MCVGLDIDDLIQVQKDCTVLLHHRQMFRLLVNGDAFLRGVFANARDGETESSGSERTPVCGRPTFQAPPPARQML